ncbi:MAG TPA: hypothetical protein VJ955_04540, partial [Desulfuromonadales bacterium]|nr:hypothetical protein [Desulfuromonadales bacterium]
MMLLVGAGLERLHTFLAASAAFAVAQGIATAAIAAVACLRFRSAPLKIPAAIDVPAAVWSLLCPGRRAGRTVDNLFRGAFPSEIFLRVAND